ncbi:MAG: penicillin-binding protein 2 [Microthrixaceae bacterium]|nr:penicillin-binding protein 2 [Microthrixaceae bacterium]
MIVVMLALLLAARVLWVGVFDSDTYEALGLSKRQRSIPLHELRGAIYDRNGEALVMSVPSKLVAVDPTLISDPEETATQIAGILGLDRIAVLDALEKPDTRYSVVAHQVDATVAEQLQAERIPGLTFSEDPQRLAVQGDLARSVIGSMDRYSTDAISGIEKLYDEELRPTQGREEVQQGIRGSTIPGSERVVQAARAGANVTLTLDRALQFMAEHELARQVAAVNAKGGTVVLGRPSTGEVLAMASVARNPEGSVVQGSLNQAIRLYEPGSVMKVVTVTTAYDMGLLTPDSTLTVPYSITLYDKTIRDSHKHPTEVMTINQILSESSNVGTIMIAQMIERAGGREKLVDAFKAFGFGKYTALGLPKEQSGVLKEHDDWNGTDIGSIPIGQSVTVSPLQMWTAYNTIANGGSYVPPVLVRDIVDASGDRLTPKVPSEAPRAHRAVSEKAAQMVTRSLEDVVDAEHGTGREFKIDGFKIAAKTGTAYKVLDNGTYGTAATRKYAASFVGFFPASDPQISIMVMIDEPGYGQHFGATAAGPVFDTLARESMRRFSIAGDTAVKPTPGKLIRSQRATAPTTTTTTTTTVPADPNAPVDPNAAAAATAGAAPVVPAATPTAPSPAAAPLAPPSIDAIAPDG